MKRLSLVLVALLCASLACGSSNTGQVVSTSAPGATSAPAKVETHAAGEVIQVQDHTITLNSAAVTNGILKANFTIENKGASELAVSSLMMFNAKDSDGTKLEQSIFDCGPQVDGKVLAGDKVKGDICWKATSATPFKVYYTANLMGSGAVVWEVK